MKRTILLTCFCLINIYVFGQKYVQRSPEVSKMMSVKDIPVSLNTGIPQISIPLFKMQVGKIEIPISLSYQANGVRIRERSGICGVKWSLNYGGVITTSSTENIYGLPEDNSKHINKNTEYSKHINNNSDSKEYHNLLGAITLLEPKYVSDIIFQVMDSPTNPYEPYIYDYSLFNYAGRISYVNNDNYILTPYFTGLKFIYDNNKIKILDDKGVGYTFSDKEESITTYVDGNDSSTSISYFLSKVKFNSNRVDYEYEDNHIHYDKEIVDEYFCHAGLSKDLIKTKLEDNIITETDIYSVCIRNIVGNNGESIQFKYNDVDNNDHSKQLSSVTKYIDNIPIKTYEFKYMYNGKYNLKRILIKDALQKMIGEYVFEYNDGIFKYYKDCNGAIRYSEDKYGYYNASRNRSNIFSELYDHNGNRDFDEDKAKIGILKSIKYPTGLKKEFVYEPNQVRINDYLDDIEKRIVKPTEIVSRGFRLKPLDILSTENERTILDLTGSNIVVEKSLVSMLFFCKSRHDDNDFNIIFEDVNNPNEIINVSKSHIKDTPIEIYLKKRKYNIYVQNNTYDVVLNLMWKEYIHDNIPSPVLENNNLNTLFSVPPFRVKEIISRDQDSINTIKYEYFNGDLISIPRFYVNKFIEITDPNKKNFPTTIVKRFYHSSPVNNTNSSSGSFVSYRKVIKRTSKGYESYDFNFKRDKKIKNTECSPWISYSDYRSKPKEIKYFNNTGKLIAKDSFVYDIKELNKIYGIKVDTGGKMYYKNCSNQYLRDLGPLGNPILKAQSYSFEEYYLLEKAVNLVKNIHTEYKKKNKVVIENTYRYEDNFNYLRERKSENSEFLECEKFRYPFDYNTDVYNKMVMKNMVDYKISIEKYFNKILYGGSEYEYKLFPGLNEQIEVSQEINIGKNKKKINTIIYEKYNNMGNINYYKTSKGEDVIILWSYKNRHPVSIIYNIKYNDFIRKYFSENSIASLEVLIDSQQIMDNLLRLKNRFDKNVHMDIYTYGNYGITTHIDKSGIKYLYKYDSKGNLYQIIDNKNNVIKTYTYKYKTQN